MKYNLVLSFVILVIFCSVNEGVSGISIFTNQKHQFSNTELIESMVLTGKIDGKYAVNMKLELGDNNTVNGYYFYESSGADMNLKGSIINDKLILKEYNQKEKHTGTFEGVFQNGIYTGVWSNPAKSKQLKFMLKKMNYSGECIGVTSSKKYLEIPDYPEEEYPYPLFMSSNKSLEKRLAYLFSFEKLTGYSISDITEQIRLSEGDEYGIREYSELEYYVCYNKHCILSITTTTVTVAAHFNYFSESYNISLINGTDIRTDDIVKPEKKKDLTALCNDALQEIINDAVENNEFSEAPEIIDMLKNNEFDEHNLNFFHFTDEGIVFEYDFGFPYVYLAEEPSGDILVTYENMKKYTKPDGPLHFIF